MNAASPRSAQILAKVLVLVVGIAITGVRAAGQFASDGGPPAEGVPLRLQSDASGDKIFAELVRHNELRTAQLRAYSGVRTYSVTDPSGKVLAKETVRMEYISPDKKTFVISSEDGSYPVRHLVLNRLIESETSAAVGKEHQDSSITPANYTFHALGKADAGVHHCFLVKAVPKRPDKYLFEGQIWIDDREFAVVRISGRPAKKLSFWITQADFVRQYEKIGGFWLPVKDETLVDVRMYGKKILTIEHQIDTVNGLKGAALRDGSASTVEISEESNTER